MKPVSHGKTVTYSEKPYGRNWPLTGSQHIAKARVKLINITWQIFTASTYEFRSILCKLSTILQWVAPTRKWPIIISSFPRVLHNRQIRQTESRKSCMVKEKWCNHSTQPHYFSPIQFVLSTHNSSSIFLSQNPDEIKCIVLTPQTAPSTL